MRLAKMPWSNNRTGSSFRVRPQVRLSGARSSGPSSAGSWRAPGRPFLRDTLMLKDGVHPEIVSERLGHADVGITPDTYNHALPGLQEAAAERFDKLLPGMATEKPVS